VLRKDILVEVQPVGQRLVAKLVEKEKKADIA
jgi:hypothetical protein